MYDIDKVEGDIERERFTIFNINDFKWRLARFCNKLVICSFNDGLRSL